MNARDIRKINGLFARSSYLKTRLSRSVTAGGPTFTLKSQIAAIKDELKELGVSDTGVNDFYDKEDGAA